VVGIADETASGAAPLHRARLRLDWLLRVAVACAFVGHGAYGAIVAKPSWLEYFGVLGISRASVESGALLSLVGGGEIAAGLLVLAKPVPALLVLMTTWKAFTEVLRPAAGEPVWELMERASNILAPAALLCVRGWPRSRLAWFRLASSSQAAVAAPIRDPHAPRQERVP
jgi:hypothetical protein